MSSDNASILLIEDNPGDARLIREMLPEGSGVVRSLEWVDSLEAGRRRIAQGGIDLVLLDLGLPGSTGLETLRHLCANAAHLPAVVVMSSLGDEATAVQAVLEGAQDYLVKGQVDGSVLIRSIRYAIERNEATVALQRAHDELENQVLERTATLAHAIESLQRENAERKRAEAALHRLNRELRAISNCNQVLMRAVDEQTLLNDICHIVCDEAGYRMAWVGYAEQDEAKTVRPVALAGIEDGYLAKADITWDDTERGRGPTGTAIRNGETVCIQDFANDVQVAPWRARALQRGYRSSIALPLKDENSKTFGALTIYSMEPNAFTPEEIRLMEELAGDLAFGITVLRGRIERKQTQEKLAHLASIVESSDDAIIGKALDERILSWNRGAERIHGYTADEIVGRSISVLVPPGLKDELAAIMAGLKRGEKVEHLETTRRRKDGQVIHVALTISPIKDTRGQIVGASTIARNITERKRVEEALFFVAQRGWQTGAENFFDALAQFLGEKLDMDYVLIDKIDENPDMAETVALYAKGAITPNLRYTLKGTPCENVMGRRLCVYPRGIQQLFPEDTLLPGMGAESYIGIPLWDSTGRPIGLIAVMGTKPLPDAAPITQLLQLVAIRAAAELERERTATLLHQRAQEFRTLVENSPDIIARYDLDCRRIYVNPAYLKMADIAEEKLLGAAPEQVSPLSAESAASLQNLIRRVIDGGVAGKLDLSFQKSDNTQLWFAVQVVPEYDSTGIVSSVMSISRDITERKRTEEQLRLQSSALAAAANAIVITDRDGKIEWVNPAFTKATGYSADEVIGRTPAILKSGTYRPEFYEQMWQTILVGKVWHGEVVNRGKDGRLFTDDTTITPVHGANGQITHFVAIKQDVTERRLLENHFRQAQKMEAIGTLAGGIAHDFNNILAVMFGFGNLLQQDTEGNAAAQEDIEEILKAAARAKELVQQILTFSRQREQKRQVIPLNTVVKEATKFLRASLSAEIKIEVEVATNAPAVLADATQIYQILLNLATNALHAMEGRPGRLTVGLDSFQPDKPFIQSHPEFQPIQYARLTVADTGQGMDAKTLERIYEPFFTTKPVGKGTGLGLSVVHGIVQSHEGIITVESQVGQGTTFRLYFPALPSGTTLADVTLRTVPRGRGEKILLLDDEPTLTASFQRLLERLNYRVTSTNSAGEAVRLFRENPAQFDLVITDLTMPDMSGLEVARQIRSLRAEVPIILATGFAPELDREKLLAAGICELLEKPISLSALAAVLDRTLVKPKIQAES